MTTDSFIQCSACATSNYRSSTYCTHCGHYLHANKKEEKSDGKLAEKRT